jgi:hypothetical protein
MSDQGAQEPLGHVEPPGRLEPPAGAVSYETVPLIGQKRQCDDEEGAELGNFIDEEVTGPGDFDDDFEGFEGFLDVSWLYIPNAA